MTWHGVALDELDQVDVDTGYVGRTVADVIRDAVDREYTPRQLVVYVEMCNWTEPGTREHRSWQQARRRLAGRLRRRRERTREYVGQLPLGWGGGLKGVVS